MATYESEPFLRIYHLGYLEAFVLGAPAVLFD